MKEPSSYLDASDIIAQCTPKSKVIIILRDGRDVLDSIVDGRKQGGWMLTSESGVITEESRLSFIDQSSKWWVLQSEVLLRTYETLSKERRFLIRYEDLLKNTFENLQKIYAFLEIPISDDELRNVISKNSFENIPTELKGEGKFYRIASPGKWKHNFNEKETQLMNKIMGDMLVKIGYEL